MKTFLGLTFANMIRVSVNENQSLKENITSHTHTIVNSLGLWDDNSETDYRPFFCQYGLIVLGPTTTTKTTSTSSTTTTTASKATTNVSIEDCPTIDLGWPHAWKVYG